MLEQRILEPGVGDGVDRGRVVESSGPIVRARDVGSCRAIVDEEWAADLAAELVDHEDLVATAVRCDGRTADPPDDRLRAVPRAAPVERWRRFEVGAAFGSVRKARR